MIRAFEGGIHKKRYSAFQGGGEEEKGSRLEKLPAPRQRKNGERPRLLRGGVKKGEFLLKKKKRRLEKHAHREGGIYERGRGEEREGHLLAFHKGSSTLSPGGSGGHWKEKAIWLGLYFMFGNEGEKGGPVQRKVAT